MTATDILSLAMSLLGVASFCAVFTILFAKYVKSNVSETRQGKHDIELIDREITESDPKAKRRKKALSITSNVLFYGFLAIILPAFAFALVSKVQGNLTGIGDNAVLVVASGSMSYKNEANSYLFDEEKQKEYTLDNQFAKYDMLFVTKVHEDTEIHLYDVVAYYNTSANALYIHRVIGTQAQSDGSVKYLTRGDANNATDPSPVAFDQIKGVYTGKKIQGLGMLVMFFQSPHGIITILSVAYSILMFNYLAGKMEKAEDERVKRLQSIIDCVSKKKDPKNVTSSFHETITYGGYVYRFDEKGFLSKEEAGNGDSPLLKKKVEENGQSSEMTYSMGPTIAPSEELLGESKDYDDDSSSELLGNEKDYDE